MKPAVLLIHGFTSHRSSLEAIIPELEKRGMEWHYPILAGHGTSPHDLKDKRWPDWQRDIEQAYQYLKASHENVVVVAMSMGTLLALELAAAHPDSVAGLVLISPCIVFKNPLAKLTPLVEPLVRRFPFPPKDKFSSPEYGRHDRGYPWFPTSAYRSYWTRAGTIMDVAKDVRCPVKIIQSRNDKIADPGGATQLYETLTSQKEICWHEKSGHEMLLDCEREETIQEIMGFAPLRSAS